MSAPPVAFDARPLVEPVDRNAVREFARRLRAAQQSRGVSANTIVAIAVGSVFAVLFLVNLIAVLSAVAAIMASAGSLVRLGFAVIPFCVVALAGTIIIVAVTRSRRSGRVRSYRLDRFARANGMTYIPTLADPPLPGMIFAQGHSRHSTHLVRGHRPRFVEFANYRYTTGSGRDSKTHRWGYVAVKLDVPLPHIVLDAIGNNGLFGASNLPAAFGRSQRLSLEGDFDRYFALYCPQGYERDALYLFTPDIMARFIDNAAQLDVEIVDDWLFLYSKRDLSTLDPATWAWLFSVVAALLDKLAQWARWRDERLAAAAAGSSTAGIPGAPGTGESASAPAMIAPPPPGVAPEGRRLKRGVSWTTFLVIGIVVAWWLVMQSGGIGRLFGG